jgi:hypothetical protein
MSTKPQQSEAVTEQAKWVMSTKEKFAVWVLIIPFSVACLVIIGGLFTRVNATYAIVTTTWTMIWLGGIGIMATRLKWLPWTPDEKEYHEGKFCEAPETGHTIIQPINTWSNLGFVAAGLLIVYIAGLRTAPSANWMAQPGSPVPLVYGLLVIFLGPGSMFFHGSGKKWGGWFDVMSMVAWVAYSLSFTAARLLQWPESNLWIMAAVIIGVIGAVSAVRGLRAARVGVDRQEDWFDKIFYILAGVWLLAEFATMFLIWSGHAPGFKRSTSWFIAAVLAYIAAFVVWIPSSGQCDLLKKFIPGIESLWCNPSSPYQGHGFWHLFSAVGALLIYLYFASEIPA